jgi:hypothetical protein
MLKEALSDQGDLWFGDFGSHHMLREAMCVQWELCYGDLGSHHMLSEALSEHWRFGMDILFRITC